MKQAITVFFWLFMFYPADSGHTQINNDPLLSPTNQALLKIRNDMLDSIRVKDARTRLKQSRIVIESKHAKNRITKNVYNTYMINRPIEKVYTRWLPSTVDKATYWKEQRRYSDSLAEARRDSILWARRGIFRKIFGTGKHYMQR